MHFIVYKTTNLINSKYYIGAHKTEDMNDSYLGSGIELRRAVKKHGIENFSKEILFVYDTSEKMYAKESELVNVKFLAEEKTYNLKLGGSGGWDHVNSTEMHLGENNSMHDPAIKSKMVSSFKATRNADREKYDAISRNNVKAAIKKNTGRKKPEHSVYMSNKMKKHWQDNKESIRDTLSSLFQLTDPTGLVYNTNRLQDFCEEHNLTYVSVWCSTKTGRLVKKGKAKGWLCKKI